MKKLAILSLVVIAGCSQTPGKGRGALVGPMASAGIVNMSDAYAGVAVTETLPEGARVLTEVSGASCKNSLLDPAPTNEKALAQLREKAAAIGANGVFAVRYAPDPLPVAKNCWAIINATGTAYTSP